ncbi:coth protein-domain-containing protein [Mortierella sp. GBAus27b]|nr:hypothetical protein BGX31_002558 [Mortierella sp. GBA43]KAI8363532.1 coth protein-domain-containing protein [Mortierella sp. GBAus27b]
MKLLVLPGLALLASTAIADVTFNVVGYPDSEAGSFGVSINGVVTKLTTTSATFPLWSGTVAGATTATSYKYVKLDGSSQPIKEESFTRTVEDKDKDDKDDDDQQQQVPGGLHTQNDFFEREHTKSILPDVPQVYDPWVSSRTKIFHANQVATIHLTANAEQYEAMLQAPMQAKPLQVDFRYINAKTLHSVNNVTMELSGKSSMEFNKMAYKFDFDTKNNQSFFSRPSIKLRSETTDPTLMREKLYIDVLNAIGVPTQQGAWIRLYINSRPVGLYLMVDDIGKSFIKQTIHQGNDDALKGSLWQMNAPVVEDQGDLQYRGPASSDYCKECYKMKTLGTNPATEPMTQMIQLMKDLQDFDTESQDAVAYWDARLDLDGFLRNMAMEYLASSWDAYWFSGSNYFMYFNPSLGGVYGGKWQWVPTDFDGTFGDGDPTDIQGPYQTYADFSQHDRPIVSKLILKNKAINARFEQTLKDIVGWVFKPDGMFPRIEAYEKMLSKEVEWEYSIDRTKYPGRTEGWTATDFHQSIAGPVKNMQWGIKPWVEGRTKDLQNQLQFKVIPGAPDRVKKSVRKPKSGSDVETFSETNDATRHWTASRAVAGLVAVAVVVIAQVL